MIFLIKKNYKRIVNYFEDINENELKMIKSFIDVEFYRKARGKNFKTANEAAIDYLRNSSILNKDPAPWFNTDYYLQKNPDVKTHSLSPLLHFIEFGHAEGRRAHEKLLPPEGLVTVPDRILNAVRVEFDVNFYLEQFPQIKDTEVDPVKHYVLYGESTGAAPINWFNADWYKKLNNFYPLRNTCFFYHYLTVGKFLEWFETNQREIAFGEFEQNSGNASRKLLKAPVSNQKSIGLQDLIKFPPQQKLHSETLYNPESLDIHWIIASFTKGSGGAMSIFRMVKWLEYFGHKCTIWVRDPMHYVSSNHVKEDIVAYFQTIKSTVKILDQEFKTASGDAIIATAWETASIASNAQNFRERFYFVQDHEPEFHGTGSLSLGARMSYDLDLCCICAGPWLEKLMTEYGRWARSFPLAVETGHYYLPKLTPKNEVKRIAFYARGHSPRRVVEMGIVALEELSKRDVIFHVDFFGDDLNFNHAPFSAASHGVLTPDSLGELYRSCDLGLVFSATNYSLIPQEMMACGLPVVELDTESTHYIYPKGVVYFSGPHPKDIADKLEILLNSAQLRKKLAEKAKKWVDQFSWEASARLVESAIREGIGNKSSQVKILPNTQSKLLGGYPKVAVIILTFNGGEVFKSVLQSVRQQRAPWPFLITIIDSGSTDGTVEFCKNASDIHFIEIPNSEFSHGGTRNRAVEFSEGEYAAFLTHDAKPADEWWLYNLVTVLDAFPEAAGVFGRHIAWPDADPFVGREIAYFFEQFGIIPLLAHRRNEILNWNRQDAPHRSLMRFYSDNNSCMRRSVWEKIPYPEIPYGEDQAWAEQILVKGYAKAYAPDAVVFHSHSYTPEETYERAKTEAIFFRDEFDHIMVKDEQSAMKIIEARNENDRKWGEHNNIFPDLIAQRMQFNHAHVMGWLDGVNC